MTPPSPSSLVERVAAEIAVAMHDWRECGATLPTGVSLEHHLATAAIRLVVEECIMMCENRMGRLLDEGCGKEDVEAADRETAGCIRDIKLLAPPATTSSSNDNEGAG